MTKTTVAIIALVFVIALVIGVLIFINPNTPSPQTVSESTSNEIVEINTKFGKIVLELFPDKAPQHVENFKKLARDGFYDGTTFHRAIPGFMIQGGDPNSKDDDRSNDGFGGPNYDIPQELNDVSHVRGVLSMARGRADSGSQFFIMVGNAPHLDADFSAFGRVIEGMDVVDLIANEERDERDNPIERIEVKIRLTRSEG